MKKHFLAVLSLMLTICFMTGISSAENLISNPHEACSFLEKAGVKTRGYKNPDGYGYFCSSPYINIGNDFPLPNNIAYYAEGDAKNVKKLKLVLNVNVSKKAKMANKILVNYSKILTKKALNKPLPAEAIQAIRNGKSGEWRVGDAIVKLVRDDWPTGKGYSLKFTIE